MTKLGLICALLVLVPPTLGVRPVLPTHADGPVELFGRRHRTVVDPEPYSDQPRETVSISGGKLEVARAEELGAAEVERLIAQWRKGPARAKVSCPEVAFPELVKRHAVLVRGTAILDLFAAQ